MGGGSIMIEQWMSSGAQAFERFVVPVFCGGDFIAASQLHITPLQFAIAKASVFALALFSICGTWLGLRKKFNRNGFKNQVLTTCVWLLVATTAFQILNILATPFFGPIIPCPYDTLFLTLAAFLVLYALWFWHLGTGKTGTFSKFGSLIVVPFAGDMFLNSKQATETGAIYLVNLATMGLRAVAHLL